MTQLGGRRRPSIRCSTAHMKTSPPTSYTICCPNKKEIHVCIGLSGGATGQGQNRCEVYWEAIPHELEHVKQCCLQKAFQTPSEEEYGPWRIQCTNRFKTQCKEFTDEELQNCINQGTTASTNPAVVAEFEQIRRRKCRLP